MENFVDTYMNLTLKSMFMLKYAVYLATLKSDASIRTKPFGHAADGGADFILKSDDNCYINVEIVKSLIARWRTRKSKRKFIMGAKTSPKKEKLEVLRPSGRGTIKDDPKKRVEIPLWMYRGRFGQLMF